MAEATFRASGLASGIDSNSIIEQLVAIESRPITQLKARQTGLKTQISSIGDIISKVRALQTAASALSTGGVLATKVDSTTTGFSAVAGTGALSGRHNIQVEALASAAQARSTAFAATTTPVRGGTLGLNVMGTAYNVTIGDGSSLADVAFAIRQSGAPVTATVINDGTNNYLSIVNNDSGYPLTGVPANALTITENYTGSGANQALGLATTQAAANSRILYNGLTINRTSNTVGDVIPGVTMSLKAITTSAETMVVSSDSAGTSANLKKFVDAFNDAQKLLQSQLQVVAGSDRSSSLQGDGAVRSLQSALSRLVTTTVGGTANVRSLADIGIKSARDGSLSLDTAVLDKAVGRDAAAINTLFSDTTAGLGAVTKTLSDNYTFSNGILGARRTGIESTVKRMDTEILNMERRVEQRKQTMIAQFTAMEKIVSSLKTTGNFLSQQKWGISSGE